METDTPAGPGKEGKRRFLNDSSLKTTMVTLTPYFVALRTVTASSEEWLVEVGLKLVVGWR